MIVIEIYFNDVIEETKVCSDVVRSGLFPTKVIEFESIHLTI